VIHCDTGLICGGNMKNLFKVLVIVLSLSLLVACQSTTEKKPVVVATMLDSEGGILGNIIILMLEANDIKTENKLYFGTPDILRAALENDEVDLVVDYTGSGQYYHPEDASDPSIWNDPEDGYAFTEKLDREKNDILWLTPAPANNTEMIAVKRDFALANNLVTMADLASYINSGKTFKLIASASFIENTMGLLGYEDAYDFKLTNDQLISLSSGNTAEMLQALSEGTNGINASLVYGTDGALDQLDLIVLEDPLQIPPVYLPAPVVRKAVLDLYPKIREILKPVFESLDLVTLQKLNASVAYEGLEALDVAKAYLVENNFLEE
jgi:osmoprotectant transport system substrate-binding protein